MTAQLIACHSESVGRRISLFLLIASGFIPDVIFNKGIPPLVGEESLFF